MGDLYGRSSSLPLQSEEDASTFLHHLLHSNNPSSSSPHHPPLFLADATSSSGIFSNRAGFKPESSSLNFSGPTGYFCADDDVDPINAESFPCVGFVDSDVISSPDKPNFCDTEGPGTSEMPSNVVLPRASSKRSRAAEVHNLSEKRRRSKINEKMKALQKLIPNSDKTDKASMLDEAIEYLKQLQLQVQMLTMRNGLSLHPLCIPGVYQPMQMPQGETSLGGDNRLLDTNVGVGGFSINQETSTRTAFDISNECTPSNHPAAPTLTNITNSQTPFSFTPVLQAHYGPFNLSTSSKEICRENVAPRLQINTNDAGKSSSGISS